MKSYLEEIGDIKINEYHQRAIGYLAREYFPDLNTKILDVGAGYGHTLKILKDLGYKNLQAIDNDAMYEEFYKENNIGFSELDANESQFPMENDYFDIVFCSHLIEHIVRPMHLLGEIRRVLKPGGLLLLITPDWRKQYKTFYRDHTHIHPYDKESIVRILRQAELTPIRIRSYGMKRGLGKLKAWKYWPGSMFTGLDMLAIAEKT